MEVWGAALTEIRHCGRSMWERRREIVKETSDQKKTLGGEGKYKNGKPGYQGTTALPYPQKSAFVTLLRQGRAKIQKRTALVTGMRTAAASHLTLGNRKAGVRVEGKCIVGLA